MSRVCELTGRGPFTGNKVSHSNIKTRTRWIPNLNRKRFLIPELGQILTLKLSSRAIRTIDKVGGISNAIRQSKSEVLSDRLKKVQRALLKPKKKK